MELVKGVGAESFPPGGSTGFPPARAAAQPERRHSCRRELGFVDWPTRMSALRLGGGAGRWETGTPAHAKSRLQTGVPLELRLRRAEPLRLAPFQPNHFPGSELQQRWLAGAFGRSGDFGVWRRNGFRLRGCGSGFRGCFFPGKLRRCHRRHRLYRHDGGAQ